MGFARAASRAFSRITPKAWRGKKKTENFDLPRNHSESKQSYVNLVGSHRDAKGKVRKYDLISDQDTGDLYVANYSAGKTKYIHSGNVIKDHTAVDFGTFENKQRAKVQGQYSGLDATVKYLKDNGINVEGLDRTMGTAKSPRFTGSLIDPRSRHTIGKGYGPNTDSHRNYVPLDALNDLQKGWRATQNKPGDPPPYGSGPAPKQPNGPDKPSGPRFKKRKGDPFSDASSRQSPPDPPKNGPSDTGTTFGPVPSQNQAGKGWRARIRVSPTTETGSAVRMPREQPQDIVSEIKALGFTPQTANVPAVREGTAPAKKARGRRKKSAEETVASTVTPSQAPQVEVAAETVSSPPAMTKAQVFELAKNLRRERKAAEQAAALDAAGFGITMGRKRPVPTEANVKVADSVNLPKFDELDNISPEQQANVSKAVQAKIWRESDIVRASRKESTGRISGDDILNAKNDKDKTRFEGNTLLSDALFNQINELPSANPKVDAALSKKANSLFQQAATLQKQNKMLAEHDRLMALGDEASVKAAKKIKLEHAAEVAAVNDILDPTGIHNASKMYNPQTGKLETQAFTETVKTGISDEDIAAYAKETGQYGSDLSNVRGIGGSIREFELPALLKDPNGTRTENLDQIPSWQDQVPGVDMAKEMLNIESNPKAKPDLIAAVDAYGTRKFGEPKPGFDGSGRKAKLPDVATVNPNADDYMGEVGDQMNFEQFIKDLGPGTESTAVVPLTHEDGYIQGVASRVAAIAGSNESGKLLGLAGSTGGSFIGNNNMAASDQKARSMLNAAGKQVPVAEQSMYESIANELGLTASDRVAHIKEMPPEQQNTAMSQAVDDELFARLEAMGIQVPLSVIEDARARGASTAVDSFMQGKYGNLDKSADNIINTINSTDQANTLKDEAFFNSALEDDLDNSNKGLQNAAINSRRNVDRLMKDEAPETESASYEQPIDENVSRLDSFGMPQHVKEFVGEGGGQAYFIQKPRDNADTPVPFSEIGSMDKSMSPENANSDTQGTWVIDDGEDLWELDHFDPSSMMDVRDPERASMLRKAIKLGLATPF
jgi:hypothetical protein